MPQINLFKVECGDFKLEVSIDDSLLDAIRGLVEGTAEEQQNPSILELEPDLWEDITKEALDEI